MLDNTIYFGGLASKQSTLIKKLGLESKKYLLCTIHRAENTDNQNNLDQIIKALNTLSRDYRIVLPLHPGTRKLLEAGKQILNFKTIAPVGYPDMLNLIQHSRLVLTDSGGLQKEACFFKKYCITMRDQTEWIELVQNGLNILTGADSTKIIEAVKVFSGKEFPVVNNLYGNGQASAYICRAIVEN